MAVFDGVCYLLSPSLSPTRRNELAAVLDLNGAAPHTPYTHIIAPAASHAYNHATADTAVKLVTDRWVDRSIVMGKRQLEQYFSPDPAMIFSGVVACATDLSVPDLEVLSAGVTALGGQWRVGLTRDVTHLFALRTGSDKYNTALHFAPQTHMFILTPHWFDDAVRLGRRIPETPYAWPDPPVLRPGVILDLDDNLLATDAKRRQKPAVDTAAGAGDRTNASNEGDHVLVWAGRRILLSTSLKLAGGSRRAIEARIQRAGGIMVRIPEDADEDVEEKAVDECDVLVTRWRCGKSFFKAVRASLLIGTLTWLFSVESSGTLHSPLDSLLWYPTPRGGIPGLIDCEVSITNYTGVARDYLKRLITLVGAKFTPSMSQSNKVLIAGFQPSPKTTRALSWSIPVVNHTWLEDCFVEWRALTVGLERYIVYPSGVDFAKILMTYKDGPLSSQSLHTQGLSGGAVPGGRGVGIIDAEQEETRDAEYRTGARRGASFEEVKVLRTLGGSLEDAHKNANETGKSDMGNRSTWLTEAEDEDAPQSLKPRPRLVQRRPDVQTAQTDDKVEKQVPSNSRANSEMEQKHTKRRRSGESVASVREEDRGGKRKKMSMEKEEREEAKEAEVEGVVSAPSVKGKPKQNRGKGKAKARTTVSSDEDMDDLAKNTPGVSQEKKAARGRARELAAIRLIATGVSLPDDIIKRLRKLGVQMTTKPMDCTHLIAKGIIRTEKFLCAMSVSPYILTEEWANASAKSGKLLPENDYFLFDAAAEQKWAFKFADAMARAKRPEGGSNLFKQMTFYVTPKVPVDTKLLKNVISAGGGQVQLSTTPTVRILKGKANRFVVSCPEDKAIWRPLVQEGFKIYSPELVLRGALRQEIEWEREECLMAG